MDDVPSVARRSPGGGTRPKGCPFSSFRISRAGRFKGSRIRGFKGSSENQKTDIE
jgi:hypothetical protein